MLQLYDLIIVGGGIAGLRVGIQTLKRTVGLKCCIIEKYNYIGGRIMTFHENMPRVGAVKWESGAGRISSTHKKTLGLLENYGLTFIPIDGLTDYVEEPIAGTSTSAGAATTSATIPYIGGNTFTQLHSIYLTPLERLPPSILSTHTLKELLEEAYGVETARRFYIKFPYYSEIHTIRADLALASFNAEMYSSEGFGICAEGMSSLTDAMRAEFEKLGGKIIINTVLNDVQSLPGGDIILTCQNRYLPIVKKFKAHACVLAVHQGALQRIEGVSHLPVLKHLQMMPLLRMYAVFPFKHDVSWFSGLNKTVTDSPIRHIIPINPKRGVIMISYTDGADAQHWYKEDINGGKFAYENVKDLVMAEIRRLFPDRNVPDPVYFKHYYWGNGCTYWKPGKYSVEDESVKSLHPMPQKMPHLFMCGESFAVHQCWIESAIEQADNLLKHPTFRGVLREIQKEA